MSKTERPLPIKVIMPNGEIVTVVDKIVWLQACMTPSGERNQNMKQQCIPPLVGTHTRRHHWTEEQIAEKAIDERIVAAEEHELSIDMSLTRKK